MTEAIITMIPLEQLRESPFNPRKVFNDASLQELATSIAKEGTILQPLLVRPMWSNPLRVALERPDYLEIVFGHRRARAARLNGMAEVPCMVQSLDDEQARRAQIAENLQREDVHPIEEAEGFRALMDLDGWSADQVAEHVGKSRSHVYGRLKLLQAVPEIRKACLAGEIGSEVALLVARLRTEKLQQDALNKIQKEGYRYDLKDGGKDSFRTIRDMLNERYALELKGAIFDIADGSLVVDAGVCATCPKRSGNAPEFADVARGNEDRNGRPAYESRGYMSHAGADVCTDPDCFDAKKKAHLVRQAKALEAKGKTVVAGNAARAAISAQGDVKGAYIALADVKDALKGKGADVEQVVIQDPRTGKTVAAVKVESLKTAGIKVPTERKAASGADNYEADRQKREAEETAREAKAKVATAVHLALFDKVRTAAADRQRDLFDMRLLARLAWDGVDYDNEEFIAKLHGCTRAVSSVHKRLDGMSADELGRFMLDCVLIAGVRVDGWSFARGEKPAALLEAAEHYGVDVDAVRAEITGEPAKKAAAKGTKKAKASTAETAAA